MKCPKCGIEMKQDSSNTFVCPECGSMFRESPMQTADSASQASAAANSAPPQPIQAKKGKHGCLIVVLACVAIIVLTVVLSNQQSSHDTPRFTASSYTARPVSTASAATYRPSVSTGSGKKYTNDEYELVLYLLAKETISGYLKSPSTAKFSKQSECKFNIGDDGTFIMTGWVDAQNSFGSTIREVWGVMATQEGDAMDIFYVRIGDNTYYPD